ncbi:hypothetical protein BD410DRAFT_789507, partial [Rickenella mellea]
MRPIGYDIHIHENAPPTMGPAPGQGGRRGSRFALSAAELRERREREERERGQGGSGGGEGSSSGARTFIHPQAQASQQITATAARDWRH